jgi:nucleoside-triphosphatase THEP1
MSQSKIAFIDTQQGQDPQVLLSDAAARFCANGLRVVGVLAEDHDGEGACSAGFLRDITTGRRFSIQLPSAPLGTSCHLDASGVEDACGELLSRIASADLVVLSKYGKLEVNRQGLWKAFATAVDHGKPLLTTVSTRHRDAWDAWAPTANSLEPNLLSIEEWCARMRLRGMNPKETASHMP